MRENSMEKENARIDGIGSVAGGEYGVILVDGIGRIKGNITTENIKVDGMLKGKGCVETGELAVDGFARMFRDVRARKVTVDGLLKLRRASLLAEEISCDGMIVCNREVSADRIRINGCCSAARLTGEEICIRFRENRKGRIPQFAIVLSRMYFGRGIGQRGSQADIVECTRLEADHLTAKVVRADSVKLGPGCVIGRLECRGEAQIEESCIIRQASAGRLKLRDMEMANASFVRVLELYKEGKITADEAEQMLGCAAPGRSASAEELPWEDDGRLRIVAFLGRKLVKRGEAGAHKIEVCYDGGAVDVESEGNLTCETVQGNVSAGNSVRCGDVGGCATAGTSVTCGDVSGNVTAGAGVRCGRVGGNIAAGGGVHLG